MNKSFSPEPGYLLVVDDNKVNRLLLARGLEQQGHRVALAENGRQALEMLRKEPFDLLLSEDLYLSSFAYLDEQHWLKGFDDSLQNRRGRHWGRLMVLKSDVAKFWSVDGVGESAAALRTGAPGRPSSIYLVEIEFRARCARNEVESSLAQEADVLAAWLRKEHPNSPPLKAKTIKNKLRASYRQHKEARN